MKRMVFFVALSMVIIFIVSTSFEDRNAAITTKAALGKNFPKKYYQKMLR